MQIASSSDIDELIRRDMLVKNAAGGRSTNYSLAERDLLAR